MASRNPQQGVVARARELLDGRIQAAVELAAAGDLVDERLKQFTAAQEALAAAATSYEVGYAAACGPHGWTAAELDELGCTADRGRVARRRRPGRAAAPTGPPTPDPAQPTVDEPDRHLATDGPEGHQ